RDVLREVIGPTLDQLEVSRVFGLCHNCSVLLSGLCPLAIFAEHDGQRVAVLGQVLIGADQLFEEVAGLLMVRVRSLCLVDRGEASKIVGRRGVLASLLMCLDRFRKWLDNRQSLLALLIVTGSQD